MLSRRIAAPTAATAVSSSNSLRSYYNAAPDPIGKAHPDLMFGSAMLNYRGRGWMGGFKQMPQENLLMHGGDSMTNMNDRHGHVQDPEDPRHPIVRVQFGSEQQKGLDGSVNALIDGKYGPIPKSSRLLQVLYNNYLEPLNMNRVCVPLLYGHKVPNNGQNIIDSSVEYMGQTVNLVGNVFLGLGCVVCEGVTMRADTNQIIIHEGCQIMENVSIIADAPTTLHHYQRQESLNPYQTLEVSEGLVKIGMNTMIEANCHIEACNIGTFSRIGHGSVIMKGVNGASFNHVLPGSVVLADTHMSEGEVWGGAPARKLGKVSKFEYKKPWMASVHHRDQTAMTKDCRSYMGDEMVLWVEEMDKLDNLMIQFEDGLSPGVKAQMREFVEGREPFGHMIARITQGWSPANRPDDKMYDHKVPSICWNSFRNHNDDSESEYTGSAFNWKAYLSGAERQG